MPDDWYDAIEEQIDRFMAAAEDVLLWVSYAGVVILFAVQLYLAFGGEL